MPNYFNFICRLSLVLLLTSSAAKAQTEFEIIQGETSNKWIHFSNVHNALYQHLAYQAYGLLDRRSATISCLNTLFDWQKRQEDVRKILMKIVGPFPEKTPLNAEVVRTIEKDDYKVEHIIYVSFRPYRRSGKMEILVVFVSEAASR